MATFPVVQTSLEHPQTNKGRILLADDEDTVRRTYAALLSRHGYDCLCAPDGASALKILAESDIDALIADIHMPGNSGLELIESVSQIASGLPVILLTGEPSIETAARSVRLSVIAYLVKPPKLEEVLALLREAIPHYRHLRAVSDSRRHLQQWAQDVAALEDNLRQPPRVGQTAATQDYLRVALRNLMLQLADLDRSIAAWSQAAPAGAELRQLDFIGAVRHTIEVLEKTRHSFQSKDLGDLRKQLQVLLPPGQA